MAKADTGNDWKELAEQKEKEWKQITELRIQALESALVEKEEKLRQETSKLYKLKEDFKYNLKLLEERDQELERYDLSFADLKASLNLKTVEISDLKIQIDEAKRALACEQEARDELQRHYQQRIKEKQAEIEKFKNNKDSEVNEERKEFENFKRNLQRKLTQVEDELDTQKRELTTAFDDAMKKREHEFRLQSDELNTKVLEYELKAKLLAKELEMLKSAQEKTSEEYQQVENSQRDLEKRIKEKDWELADIKALKDAKIADLEKQLQHAEVQNVKTREDFQRKFSELDRNCREKETIITKLKEASTEREQELQSNIRELQSQLENAQIEIRKLQWTIQDLQKDKDTKIESLEEEIQQLKESRDKQLSDVSRDQVNKDVQLQAMRENEERWKADLLQRKQDLERYKKELSLAAERENALERSKVQLDLDWQRRFEDIERQQYEKSEDLVKKLTRSRDDALANVKEKSRELEHRDSLIRALHRDKEQAIATLRKHKITVDKTIEVNSAALLSFQTSEEMKKLEQQNESLKAVIKEMRMQMEDIGHCLPTTDAEQNGDTEPVKEDSKFASKDYVENLEKQVRSLREKNRKLQSQVEESRKYGKLASIEPVKDEEVMFEVKDNALVRTHIQSLNENIGILRTEKVELAAQVKKQQARIQYLESSNEKLAKEPKQKQVEINQLQYELGAIKRRSAAELESQKQRISDLELQLTEARKEADEYYKGTLERNMEVTALRQEISSLKMDLADQRPALNFGAQELVIQQLEDEINRLKKQAYDASYSGVSAPQTSEVDQLRQKLKTAAKHIAQLAQEKQQLIEMGNRLRAELKSAGVQPSVGPPKAWKQPPTVNTALCDSVSSHPLSQNFLDRLGQLEKLQYMLTRQQLQYAQKFPSPHQTSDGPSNSDEDARPPSILKKSGDSNVRYPVKQMLDVQASHDTMNDTQQSAVSFDPSILEDGKQREQLMLSMSSGGGESIQEIWKMLEEQRPTPTPRPTRQDTASSQNRHDSSQELVLKGNKSSLEYRSKSEIKLSEKAHGKLRPNTQQKKPRVRNYNTQDDSFVK